MRLGNASNSRPAWYDRNATTKLLQYANVSEATYSAVTRWTYTVPSGRKAQINTLAATAIRDGTAAAALRIQSYINYAAPNQTAAILSAITYGAAIDSGRSLLTGEGLLLQPGDAISGLTLDGGTTGTATYFVGAALNEFDA